MYVNTLKSKTIYKHPLRKKNILQYLFFTGRRNHAQCVSWCDSQQSEPGVTAGHEKVIRSVHMHGRQPPRQQRVKRRPAERQM